MKNFLNFFTLSIILNNIAVSELLSKYLIYYYVIISKKYKKNYGKMLEQHKHVTFRLKFSTLRRAVDI